MEKGDPELFRVVGAAISSFLPLLYVKPINIRDALARGVFSVVNGYVFYFVPMEILGWAETPHKVMAGAVAAGSASWFLAGALIVRWVRKAKKED